MASEKIIRSRSLAREAAVRALYQINMATVKVDKAIEDVIHLDTYAPDAISFINELVRGVKSKQNELDKKLKPLLAKGWDFSRISKIDREVLRLACYELFYIDNIPPKVSINEAVKIALKYGSSENSKFVNGLLGKLFEKSPKKDWDPSKFEKVEPEVEEEVTEPDNEIEVVEEGSDTYNELKKAGKWTLKTDS